jgi:hypothetical protein
VRVGRVLREPLLHFFALGAAIFAFAALIHEPGTTAGDRIVVTRGQIAHLVTGFARTWQRAPTDEERDGLVADWVRDEVYYREGVALGLERDDSVIRRRVRQKMEFMVEDAAADATPSEEDLRLFLAAHAERFRREPVLTLRQVYVNADRRGPRAEDDARALLARLTAAGSDAAFDDLGDPSMLPREIEHQTASAVARIFGDGFADAVETLEPGRWTGPIASGYGLHLVLLRGRDPGAVPPLDQVRADVARELQSERRQRMVDAAYDRLRARYEVVVETPASTSREIASGPANDAAMAR